MNKKKFVYLELKVQCGEYSFDCKSVHEIGSRKSTAKFGEDYAKTFYDNKSYSDDNVHYFNGGEIAVRCRVSMDIPKAEYDVLTKFL